MRNLVIKERYMEKEEFKTLMDIPELYECNVIACAIVPAAQTAIALVPAVPSLCWTVAAAI